MPRPSLLSRARLGLGRTLAGAAATLTRSTGRGGGTTLPGRVLLAIAPSAIRTLGARLPSGSALVTATNGKTTTSSMAATILGDRFQLAHNRAGANLASGIASTLVSARSAELGLLEVDEAAFPELSQALAPRAVVMGNLFRDQLDRYGELETIAEAWRDAVRVLSHECTVIANADDPRVVDIAAAHPNVRTFGIDDPAAGSKRPSHASDARTCFNCGEPLAYDAAYVGHLGDWHCTSCDARRPAPAYVASEIREHALEGVRFRLTTPDGVTDVELSVPGLYNVYNALAAAALTHSLGAGNQEIAARLLAFRPAFGRLERVAIGDKSALLLLAKNPAGANEVVRTLSRAGELEAIVIALNDDIADGRDVSWIWDVELEELMPHAKRVIASGSRAEELALRFKYGGFPSERLEVERDLAAALDRGLALTSPGEQLAVIPTYTAMLALQRVLTERGLAKPYWERAHG
ncbi:MAG: MurT ligase domain-containing protein [Gaiellaceae bacterium]